MDPKTMTELLQDMTPEQRLGALAVLDALTRPMTTREIETAMRQHGVSKSRAVIAASSLKGLNIVAMIGGER
jgi:hypothetical protein